MIVEGQEYLAEGLTTFNKIASETFQSLDDVEKEKYADIAANDTDVVLTDTQTQNVKKVKDIFSQLRNNTVSKTRFLGLH